MSHQSANFFCSAFQIVVKKRNFALYYFHNIFFTMKKILLLGSGELGKEFTIAAQRLGQHVIACDAYAGAPAMQVADEYEVF